MSLSDIPSTRLTPPPAAATGGTNLPPGMERNLLFFAWRKFRPKDPILLFEHLARTYGDIAHYRVGPARFLFLNHPEYFQDVLIRQPEKFIKERTQQRAKMLLGNGMITAEGAAHRHQRQVAQPAFHRQRIGSYAETMVRLTAERCAQWHDGATLDLSQEMMHLTLEIAAATLFGAPLGPRTVRLAAAINEIMGMYNLIVPLPAAEVLVHLPLPRLRRFKPARRALDEVVYELIDARRQSGEHRDDLLGMMLDAAENTGEEFDRDALRDQVLTIFLAGYETVANALTWTWYLLSQNLEAEAKLHAEVDAVLAGRRPAFDHVPRLPYTEMVFAESLRLYPPAWAMGRLAVEDFSIGSYRLPKGTTVLMSQYILHRDARFFPDPLRFLPERFSPEAKAAMPRFTYLPFGAGTRRCIGEAMAWMEGVLLLATVAQRWKLRLVPGHLVRPQPLITLRPRYGMRMTATLRQEPSLKHRRAV